MSICSAVHRCLRSLFSVLGCLVSPAVVAAIATATPPERVATTPMVQPVFWQSSGLMKMSQLSAEAGEARTSNGTSDRPIAAAMSRALVTFA